MANHKKNNIYKKQRDVIKHLFLKGLKETAPERMIRQSVSLSENVLTIASRSYDLFNIDRIWVFGSGKASGRMALEIENILGNKIYDGIVITAYGLKTPTIRIQQFEAAHPCPDLNSLSATYELMDVARDTGENDLVIFLMSGGTSSLLCMPDDGIELEEVSKLYKELLISGAPIRDMNKIRKSISKVKGGRLRPLFGDAIVEMLAVSDVPDDDPLVIGSSPLLNDPVSPEEALLLLRKYGIEKKIPGSVIRHLNRKKETKESVYGFTGYETYVTLLATARKMAEIIENEARKSGYQPYLHKEFLTGEARMAAKKIASHAVEVLSRDHPVAKPAALIYYGESSVTVKGSGKGGRNQEMALSAAMAIEGQHYITFLAAGTDGRDGQTNAAGAICNAETCLHSRSKGVNPEPFLENNDSWNFFRQEDGLLITGDTGNNLMDIQLVLIEK